MFTYKNIIDCLIPLSAGSNNYFANMLEITCLFYYAVSFGCLFLSYFYLRNRGNLYGQSFILLFGLLGLYVCLSNGWHHGHWILYTLISLVLFCILSEDAGENPHPGKIFLWSVLLFVFLQILFFIDSDLYQNKLRYTRRGIIALLAYTFTKIILHIQQHLFCIDKDTSQNIYKFHHKCFLMIALVLLAFFNGLCTGFTDVATFFPAVLCAHAPSYTETQLAEFNHKNKLIRERSNQNKQSDTLLKEKEAIIQKNQQSIAELTEINERKLANAEKAQSKAKELMDSINEKNDFICEKSLVEQAEEKKIKQMLRNEQKMREEIQRLTNCISNGEQNSLQNLQLSLESLEKSVENLDKSMQYNGEALENLSE